MIATAPANQLMVLVPSFQFRHADEVEAYLSEHDFLVPILLEAASPIKSIFGPDTQLVLEVAPDPETESGRGKLYLLIQTHESAEEALKKQDQLDREWWLRMFPKACCRM